MLDAVERGTPRREAARLFGVSLSTIKRYIKRRREGGDHLSPRPLPPGRTPPRILATAAENKRALLLLLWGAQLEANGRDATLLERHCELWEQERGVRVLSVATMSRAAVRKSSGGPSRKVVGGLRAKRPSGKCLAGAPERSGPEAAGARRGRIFH